MPSLPRTWRLPIAARLTRESAMLPDSAAAGEVQKRLGRSRIRELGFLGWVSWNPVIIPLALAGFVLVDRFVVPPLVDLLPFAIPFPLNRVVESLATIAPILAGAAFLQRRAAERVIREVLLERGIPVCRRCGHALRGLGPDAGRCPECGDEIDERQRALIDAVADARDATDPAHPGEDTS